MQGARGGWRGPRIGALQERECMSNGNGAEPRFVILGAGPTGLGAGYRLKELGRRNFTLYDRNGYVGGLAHSFTDGRGFTWDIGGDEEVSHHNHYHPRLVAPMG